MLYGSESSGRGPGPGAKSTALRKFFLKKLEDRARGAGFYDDYGSVAFFEGRDSPFLIHWRWSDTVISVLSINTSNYDLCYEDPEWDGNPDDFVCGIDIDEKMAKILLPLMQDKMGPLKSLALSSVSFADVMECRIKNQGRVMTSYISPLQ